MTRSKVCTRQSCLVRSSVFVGAELVKVCRLVDLVRLLHADSLTGWIHGIMAVYLTTNNWLAANCLSQA